MRYWRMQLHPAEPQIAMKYAVESIAAGFVGLDFKQDPGDLRKVQQSALQTSEKDFLTFATEMSIGDKVLIIVHHFPFALVTVSGDYNYVKEPVPEIGVWFRHFRRIDRVQTKYHADRTTNAQSWEQFKMTDTISPLNDPGSKSYKLIEDWK